MIIKLAGGILVMVSCSLGGIYFSRKEDFRIQDLEEMKKAFIILKSEIEYSLNTLPDALLNISYKTDRQINSFFLSLSQRLTGEKCGSFDEAWRKSIAEELSGSYRTSGSYLKEEDIKAFERLGQTLGYLDKKLQINSIDTAISYIDDKAAYLRKTGEKNKRMYRSIGVICGLLLITVFI